MLDYAISPHMSRQTLYYPPQGRPGWASESRDRLELLYLAWGWRKYHKTPQRPTQRDGWLYFTVRSGSPLLDLPGQAPAQIEVDAGDLILLHPDCRCGWSDHPRAKAEVCTWVWRSPSRWPALLPPEGKFLRLRLDKKSAQAVQALHHQTRVEIGHSDENTLLALEALRLQLDLVLARSLSANPAPASDSQRLDLACRWIGEHLSDHSPVTGLGDYLQLSPSTLNRLFQRGLGVSVRSFAKKSRLARARFLIETQGMSVKEAAYVLGYRFPNDLSRAFAQSAAP